MIIPKGRLLFILAFFVGVLVTAFFRWPPTQSSDWAAWVQAVGSIGAIGGSFYLGSRQAQWQIREARNVDRQKYLAIAEVTRGCLERIKKTADLAITDSTDLLYVLADTQLLDQSACALEGVQLHEVGSAKVIVAWATFAEKSRLTYLVSMNVTTEEAIRLEATTVGASKARARAVSSSAANALEVFETLHKLINAETGKV